MRKKIFVPARICRGYRWYISYHQYNPHTELRENFRPTFDLNRIKNIAEREKHANACKKFVNDRLPDGYPFEDYYQELDRLQAIRENKMSIREALEYAVTQKTNTLKKGSAKGYQTAYNQIITYLAEKKMLDAPIEQFTRSIARLYASELLSKTKRNATFNNKIIALGGLWTILIEDEFIKDNPWKKIKKLPEQTKLRRDLTIQEREILASYFYEKKTWFFYAICLQFYCFIRPVEISRLRFKNFDLINGLIHVPGDDTKNGKSRTATIPNVIIWLFRKELFTKHSANYFLFGPGCMPHPRLRLNDKRFNKIHRAALLKMKREKVLDDITGLTFYSWKDTGMTEHIDLVGLNAVNQQADHATIDTTLKYYHPKPTNEKMKTADIEIIKKVSGN